MSTSVVASAETVSFYCHTCSGRFSLPAPSSPFHFTLCPRCRGDYLDDSPTPHQAPMPVLPPPPPPLPPLSIPSLSSSPSSTTLTSRSPPTAGTVSASQDLLPPPLPPWLLQASQDLLPPPPPPLPPWLLQASVSPSTRPSSSSTRPPPPPTSSHGAWDYFFFGPSDSVVPPAPKEGTPSNISIRQVRREFRFHSSPEEQRLRSSTAVSPLSSAYSSARASPQLASPPPLHPLHRHQDELQPESSPPLALSSSSTTSRDPSPPPPPPWDSPLHGAWDDEYIISPPGSDYDSPPRPPPPPPLLRVSSYGATFGTPLQLGGSRAPPPPVSAYDATFDTQFQRGGSQAAPAESIAALPTVTVTDSALVCAVCTDPLLASAPARLLPCGHMYHSDCIVTWLSLRNSCPVCRASIPMFHSTATDIASSPSPPLHPTPPGRRRSLPGAGRIRRICSRLLRRTESSRDRQTNSSGDVHV